MSILFILSLIVGFIILWKSSNMLIDGAASIAHHFKISELIIGLTLLAFGTSIPEVVVNIIASFKGKGDIIFGNIIGSNIANILLILGITGLILPLTIKKSSIKREIPFSLFCTGLLAIVILTSPHRIKIFQGIELIEGLTLLFFFIMFLYFTYKISGESSEEIIESSSTISMKKSIILCITGIIFIPVGGKIVIESAINIAQIIGISEALISITAIAFGTSLPELITSVAAAKKNKPDMIMGNIIGSLIFNTLFAFGISALINPIPFNQILRPDLFVLLGANILLILFLFLGEKYKLNRAESFVLLVSYFIYISYIIYRG